MSAATGTIDTVGHLIKRLITRLIARLIARLIPRPIPRLATGRIARPGAALGALLLTALLALQMTLPAQAQAVLAVPALSGRVIDQTGTLNPQQTAALDAKLAAFEAQAGPQIVLLMVPTVAPEDIAAYAQRVADTWKIGRREIGDGVLVVVAKGDRRVRTEVAKALEGAIPDLAARQIIDGALSPAFRADDYAGGLNAAVDRLIARIRGEDLPAPTQRARAAQAAQGSGLHLDQLAMFFFVAVPVLGAMLSRVFGRKLGSLLTAGGAGAVGWWLSASVLLGVGAGMVALLLVGVFGIGAAARGLGRGGPGIGGWGGGGNFGGGGASGGW